MADVTKVSTTTLVLSDVEVGLIECALALVATARGPHTVAVWVNGDSISSLEMQLADKLLDEIDLP